MVPPDWLERPATVVVDAVRVDGIVQQTVGILVIRTQLAHTHHCGLHVAENRLDVRILVVKIVGHDIAVRNAGGVGVIHQIVLHHPDSVLGTHCIHRHKRQQKQCTKPTNLC